MVATELGKALADEGHEVHFITYSQPVRLTDVTDNLFYHEVRVSDYPLFDYPPYELVLTNKLVEVVKYEGLELLHVHYAIPHASAAYLARKILADEGIRIPFITTLHGTDITLVGRDPSFAPVITHAINKSDAVTAVSESLRGDTLKHFEVNRAIHVIPNFINLERYKIQCAQALRNRYAPNGEKVVMHISNFRKVKRVEDIVHVFNKVRKALPAKMIFVGDGPERSNIEQLCRELGTCHLITFLGKINDTNEILPLADLFMLTSETESFGLAALEAMACGVPVISTNTGGLPEVNKHDYSGYLSNVGDVEDMATHAIGLLSDEAKLATFKLNARAQAERFDIAQILPQYEEVYRMVTANQVVEP